MVALLDLANEVLALILHTSVQLDQADLDRYYPGNIKHAMAIRLTVVCRQFYHLVIPFLYTDIRINLMGVCHINASSREAAGIRRTWLLHRTFRTNTSLWRHCRRLEITSTPGPHDKDFFDWESPASNRLYIAVDCLTWLTGITEVVIIYNPECWRFPRPICFPGQSDISLLLGLVSQNLKQLKLLDIFSRGSLSLPVITTGIDSGCLQTLELTGVSEAGKPQDWDFLLGKAGTASFTKLKLSHFAQSSRALQALVMWPAKLEAFTFYMPGFDRYSGQFALTRYTLATMQAVLAPRKDSLAYIKIGELGCQGLHNFDVSDFYHLHTLDLTRDLTGTDVNSVANLVAPNLKEFFWDMALEDQQCGIGIDGFCQPDEAWLRAFARAAIEGKSPVHIHIKFQPEPWTLCLEEQPNNFEYPWDRMDRLAREIQVQALKLSYDPPNMSKEEFINRFGITEMDPELVQLDLGTLHQGD